MISDGAVLGIGGNSQSRKPMTLIRELVRVGRRDLTAVTLLGSMDVEYLLGGGCVRSVRAGYVGFDLAGLAPLYAAAPDESVVVETEASIVLGLQAAASQLDFLPSRGSLHTDVPSVRPDVRVVRSPYSGQAVIAWPALHLDIALLHVPLCTVDGTAVIEGAAFLDPLLAEVAEKTIVTAERIVDALPSLRGYSVIRPDRVSAVVQATHGAYPLGCYPHYRCDLPALIDWTLQSADAAKSAVTRACAVSEDDYLASVFDAAALEVVTT